MDSKYKKVNDQLSEKTKELKKFNSDFKKAEKKSKELSDIISDKNKKISELENSNTRLKLMKDQAKEMADKQTPKNTPKSPSQVMKCKYENRGNCRNGSSCDKAHPKTTCQSHSKLGSCPMQLQCDHRHPFGICYDWQTHGGCYRGDSCRNRHPVEMAAQRASNSDPFLGHGSPGGPHRDTEDWRAQSSQWSPSQIRHHDQRGRGRW